VASAEKRGNGKRPWRARYLRPDGTYGSEPGFATKAAALKWGGDQEADIRAGRWRDPRGGRITLDEWWEKWLPVQEYSRESLATLESIYRRHLRPWRGEDPIGEIGLLDVQALKQDKSRHFSESIVGQVMSLLKMLMDDALLDGRLAYSPMPPAGRRRGSRRQEVKGRAPRPGVALDHGTFLALAARLPEAGVLGPMMAVAVVLSVFTGMRWGEVFGMQRKYLMLIPGEDGRPAFGWYIIDDEEGSLHVPSGGRPYLGPPKGYAGRTVELPAFLVEILLLYVGSLPADRQPLFTDTKGDMLYRDGSHYDAWRRSCDGWPGGARSRPAALRVPAAPIAPGLHWHDLRHTAKTWLVEDGVPAVARDERLGHTAQGDIVRGDRGGQDTVYVHVTPVMRARVLDGLQRRWESDPAAAAALTKLISQFFPSRSPGAVAEAAGDQVRGHGRE
jgi:integrase